MKKYSILALGVLLVSAIYSPVYAVEKPKSMSTDYRIKVVSYQQNNVVPVRGTTFINTQIVFGQNEQIIDVEGGDAASWTVHVSKALANVLNVKPTVYNSNSNLMVATVTDTGDRHYYRFHLISNKTANASDVSNPTYVVQFIYPDEERAKLLAQLNYQQAEKKAILNASQNPKDYNWDYSFNGAKSIMPLHVFDDGKFTYMQLQQNQDIPAVFAVDNPAGKESVVNYRRVGDYLVIEQVAPQLTLRDGKYAVASIFNNSMISKLSR